MREIRDKILSILSYSFNDNQLKIIDGALASVLSEYDISIKEKSLTVINNGFVPEVYEFLARKKSKGLSKGTLRQYEQVLRSFFIATEKPIKEITDWDVINFLDGYEKCRNIGKERKDSMRRILNTFFRYMIDSGKIKINPMATIENIKFKKKVRQPLTAIEFEKVRRACKTLKERALIEFFFATGCRVSEVVNVNKCDIDYKEKRLKILGKGNKERWVFLNASSIVALEEYLENRTDCNEALFVSDRQPHQRLKKNAIEKIIGIIGERSKIGRKLYPHLIRHTTATYLYQHGMRIEDLQVILGHESADTTRIYAKDDPSHIKHAYMRTA